MIRGIHRIFQISTERGAHLANEVRPLHIVEGCVAAFRTFTVVVVMWMDVEQPLRGGKILWLQNKVDSDSRMRSQNEYSQQKIFDSVWLSKRRGKLRGISSVNRNLFRCIVVEADGEEFKKSEIESLKWAQKKKFMTLFIQTAEMRERKMRLPSRQRIES